ncbi:SgcJ/EcaC family oxidoreductase [Caulobacter sp. FWC2]|uniref:SgcJ/EcaC family oxidoreductase n=1 Tax=Caulobacter sp. FWC2 TaxID=69664 RepID=UPI000C157285|nr:SgcJ/EcaC family oxidoreductase [Caulobacter sp. FWC2]PIB91119.1 DUF4440 domain-containing protein [Caulobacter sp. FWC2]
MMDRRTILAMGGLTMAAEILGMTTSAAAGTPEIEGLIKAYFDAWNANAPERFADIFWPDGSWVNVVGMHWRGRDQVVFAHVAFLKTIFKDCKQTLVSTESRLVAPGVALAVVTLIQDAYVTPDGHSMPRAHDRLTLMAVEREGAWRFIHGHNTIVNDQAANNDPVLRMKVG